MNARFCLLEARQVTLALVGERSGWGKRPKVGRGTLGRWDAGTLGP